MDWLWDIPVIAGPVPWIVYGTALALILLLVIRRITAGWVVRALLGVLLGGVAGLGLFFLVNASNAFGDPVPVEVGLWAAATLAAVGLAVVSLWKNALWRKIVAGFSILWFLFSGMIGINAFYGLNPTLGSIFGIVALDAIVIPTPDGTPTEDARPLYERWTPPADMPAKGTVGTQNIPGTTSGFAARPAGIYLPPAALVKDAPALPVVIFMMGFPGNPDPSYIAATLDEYAAKNKGLAPIAVVADQLGSSGNDPACADSKAYGNAETYITVDVVDWVKKNLHVVQDSSEWVIGGYSNGGGCSVKYGAKDPQSWRNIIAISGEEYPGSEDVASVTQNIYGGDAAAFEASKPVNIMKAAPAGTYDHMNLIQTAGGNDGTFQAAAQTVGAEAKAVGMSVDYYEIPGAGHTGDALTKGLEYSLGKAYPLLGLSAQ